MTGWNEIRLRLRALFRRADFDRDLNDEIAFHLDKRAEKLQDPSAARRRFGNPTRTQENLREMRGWGFVEHLWQDTRFALRQLRLNPRFALAAILPLALAIGCTAAVFTLTDAVLFRSTGVKDPDHVAAVYGFSRAQSRYLSLSYPDFRDVGTLHDLVESSAAYIRMQAGVRFDTSSELMNTEMVTGDYFHAEGITPALGRPLLPEDDSSGAPPTALISYTLWENRFQHDPSVIGRAVRIDNINFTIVGVMPRDYQGMLLDWMGECSLWLPLKQFNHLMPANSVLDYENRRDAQMLMMLTRLRPGVRVEQLQAALDVLAPRVAVKPGDRFLALPAAQARFWPAYRAETVRFLNMLITVCAAALLIACFNLANLLLARGAARQREIGTRLAIGAGRFRVLQQFLVENAVIAGCACVLSVPLAMLAAGWLQGVRVTHGFSLALNLTTDPRALAAGMLAGLATGIVAGLLPAWKASRGGVVRGLRGTRSFGWRDAFGVAQVACAMAVLVAAALLLTSLRNQGNTRLGYDPRGVLIGTLDELNGTNPPAAEMDRRRRALLAEIRAQAPEASFAWQTLPSTSRATLDIRADAARDSSTWTRIQYNWVSDGYFEMLRMPLLSGRGFLPSDDRQSAPVAIVNRTAAAQLWPGENPLGRHFRMRQESFDREIVGVAEDSRYYPLGADEGEVPYLFLPAFQRSPGVNMILQVRTAGAPLAFAPILRQILGRVEPDAALYSARALPTVVSDGLEPMRMVAQQIGAISVLGVALAVTGIFASGAYRVAQQKQEIAIRIAIGASAASVIRTFTARGLWTGIAGALLGLAPALWGARLLRASVPGAGTPGSSLLALAATVLACAAALAALAAASRISRVQPADVLRVQ